MNDISKKIISEITELEREKELLVGEKNALGKKISDKKREIAALEKRLKKAKKTEKTRKEANLGVKERNSLKTLLFLPVISATLVLSVIYWNGIFPFKTLGFLSAYYPLLIPFMIFSISFICLIASIFYFVLYQVIQNYVRRK